MLELASDVCQRAEQNEVQEEQSIIDRIIIYIDEHYTDHTLSLETVAFEFGISPSHASRTFKEMLGINFRITSYNVCYTKLLRKNAVTSLRTEIEQSRLAQLTQAKVVIDGRIKELSEIATRISYDKRLAKYQVHDPITNSESIQALDQYKATSSMIGEIYLYFHNDDKIYSRITSYNVCYTKLLRAPSYASPQHTP